ncbi:MAG: hypothetical protein HYV07_19585 [Deltaproteobacteria bacterium]|nr:hypothetical protein [Deltaproteobacteria bacterium]
MRNQAIASALFLTACSSPVEVAVQLVNPCNRDVIDTVEFLKFEPRGQDIDSAGLTTITEVGDRAASPIEIPLTRNFQLVVTGHTGGFDTPPTAIGVSAIEDLSSAEDTVSLRVAFAGIDQFYRTTDLGAPETCTEMQVPRYGATATTLSSGKVLIVGGAKIESDVLEFVRTIEMFDPATGAFVAVGALPSTLERAFHTATLLDDGRVLIAGGQSWIDDAVMSALKTAVIVDARDPAKLNVSDGIVMFQARTGHGAVRLANGKVAMVGGRVLDPTAGRPEDHGYLTSIELFDPDRGSFLVPQGSGGGAAEMQFARFAHSVTLLKTGRDLLVAGGFNENGPVRTLEVVKVGDDDQVQSVASSGTSDVGPIQHAAAVADDGRVLLVGGYDAITDAEPPGALPRSPSANAEMWEYRDAQGDVIKSCNGALATGRGFLSLSMAGRRAVAIGGRGADGLPLLNGELATLTNSGPNCFATLPTTVDMTEPRADHVATTLPSGEILVVGGRQNRDASDYFGTSTGIAEVFAPAREL